jgi:hypothetical protein
MLAEKNLYFLIKKTPEQDLKKFGIPNTPSLRRQMSIRATSSEQVSILRISILGEQKTSFGHIFVPGVDVMITIFCDFANFRRKNWRFSQKSNVMIKIFHNLVLF